MTFSSAIRFFALMSAAVVAPALAANWADRGEYDLVMSIRAEASAQKRVELLDLWQTKYPQSQMRHERRELYLAAYGSLGNGTGMLKVAREMMTEQPGDFVGVYWCTLLPPQMRESSAEVLDVGEKAAKQLLSGLDRYFASASKPAGLGDDEWKARSASAGLLAHRTLGWIAWQRGDLAGAAKEFRTCLDQSPANAEITAWMGMVSALQKEPEKQSAALFYLERAAALKGEGGLPEGQRRAVSSLADAVYAAYHGDSDGLDALKTNAAASPAPAVDFRVETAAAIAERRADEELTRTNPQLAAWVHMRRGLEGQDGDKYLESLRAAPVPKLKGTVMRVQPEIKPSEIVLGMNQPLTEEVTLHVSQPFPNAAPAGTELEFEGAVESFTKQPFMLTISVDQDKITGWPEPPARGKK